MKAIGYIRVSTEEQSADDKYGIEVQKQAISDYANRNDFEIVCWLTDTISGAKDNRPELDKILYNADQLPAHEAVIVFKNDRVARDTKLYFYYFYTLEKRNVKLLSTEEHFSEGDDFANIYRSLLMFVAEQERKNIALRTGRTLPDSPIGGVEMKKILSIMLTGVLMLAVSGCGAEPQHKVSYVSGEKLTVLEQYDCVAVYTQYTNDSSETAVPADEVSVKAFQNGVELSPLVPTGDRTNGYVQCDSNVQSGTTADVVWLFELDDDSTVSVELSGGEKVEIPLTEE